MPWIVGNKYTRAQIQTAFPALELRGAVARNNNEVAVVLLRNNEPGWYNEFLPGVPRGLKMEVNRSHPTHNAALMNAALTKLLFWSLKGGEYEYFGPIRYVRQEKDPALGLFFFFNILDANAPVPAA